jgi:hypothetical protein
MLGAARHVVQSSTSSAESIVPRPPRTNPASRILCGRLAWTFASQDPMSVMWGELYSGERGIISRLLLPWDYFRVARNWLTCAGSASNGDLAHPVSEYNAILRGPLCSAPTQCRLAEGAAVETATGFKKAGDQVRWSHSFTPASAQRSSFAEKNWWGRICS